MLSIKKLTLLFVTFFGLFACNTGYKQDNTKNKDLPKGDSISAIFGNPYQSLDKSPMDMIYYPVNYPIKQLENPGNTPPVARIIYSRPHKQHREIFGNDNQAVVKFGNRWRLGANEASELQLFRTVMINGKNVTPGRYTLYAIPHPNQWTIFLNAKTDNWGLQIDSTKDVVSLAVATEKQDPPIEDFTMIFQEAADGASLLIAWDSTKVSLPIHFKN